MPQTHSVSPNRCDTCVFYGSRGRRSLYTEVIDGTDWGHLQIWDRATMRNRERIVKIVIYGLIVVAVLIGGRLGKHIFSALFE